jgi:hypothetical protein
VWGSTVGATTGADLALIVCAYAIGIAEGEVTVLALRVSSGDLAALAGERGRCACEADGRASLGDIAAFGVAELEATGRAL